MRFNDEQLEAINFEGSNVLVSAGAGSGKTAVLTERILRKLKEGVNIDSLVIITFTKAAAAEMKERIKLKIEAEVNNGNDALKTELIKVESANISTFDSFSLNLLKTYHYKLGLSKDIQIGEGLVFSVKTEKLIEEYFTNNLDSKLLKYFAVGGTSQLYNVIRNSYMKYSINIDYEFSNNNLLDLYYKMLKNEVDNLVDLFAKLDGCDFAEEYVISFNKLIDMEEEELYEELVFFKTQKVALSRKKDDENQAFNEVIKEIRESIKPLFDLIIHNTYEEDVLAKDFSDTTIFKNEIKAIYQYIDKHLMDYKINNSIFDFIDVSKLVIKLLQENNDVRLNIKNSINEVLIDEYQDTVAFQDQLVALITENNIFMVGDVKQAIYGFRNATPASFNNALSNPNCKKIFLNFNYRSCKHVINGINNIFAQIMNLESGGVDYNTEQMLKYGNTSFDNISHEGISFITYENEGNKHELEAQLIANDIKEKIANSYVGENNTPKFSDFAILCRSKSQFDIYAKVLNANNINVNAFSDVKYMSSFEIILVKNLFKLYVNKFDKLAMASILRSFLYEYSDQEIEAFINNGCEVLINKLENVSGYNNYQLYNNLLVEFDILSHIKYLEDPSDALMRLRYTFDLMNNFDALNYTVNDVITFFNEIKEMDSDITFSYEKSSNINAVTLMTIHKSKGLEFPYVYMPALDKLFSINDIKERVIFTPEFGLIMHKHYVSDDVTYAIPTYDNKIFKVNYYKEMQAEEMRLLYVAMTRAKQDLIFITDITNKEKPKSRSYMMWLHNFMGIDIPHSNVEITKNITKDITYEHKVSDKFINVAPTKVVKESIKRASQLEVSTVDKHQQDLINEGNRLHLELEYINFLKLDEYDTELVNNLKQHTIFTNIKNYYSEYEYMHEGIHGIIDLLVENDDEVLIIDYKLKNINKTEYIKQLEIYKNYVLTITSKPVKTYLYSIIDNEVLEVK